MTALVEQELEGWLQTKVSIGQIDIGLLNRFIVDQLKVEDQQGDTLAYVPRFSASFDILPLLKGEISIRTVQLYGFKIRLRRASESAPLNAAFLLDKFRSKDKKAKPFSQTVRVNSILIRRGTLSYDVENAPRAATGTFCPTHLDFKNLSATVSLKHYSADSLRLVVKRMGFAEQSGLRLSRLRFELQADRQNACINDLLIRLPHSHLIFTPLTVSYTQRNDSATRNSATDVTYACSLMPESHLSLSDLAPLIPKLYGSQLNPYLTFSLHGDNDSLSLSDLQVSVKAPSSRQNAIALEGQALLWKDNQNNALLSSGSLAKLQITPGGMELLVRELPAILGKELPQTLISLNTVDATAKWKKTKDEALLLTTIHTQAGNINAQATIRSTAGGILSTQSQNLSLTAELDGEEIDLDKLLPEKQLGKTQFTLQAEADMSNGKLKQLSSNGEINSFEYKGYAYKHGLFAASYEEGQAAQLNFRLDDLNASFNAIASITSGENKKPNYKARIEVEHLNPYHLHWAGDKQRDMEISLVAKADCDGSELNDLTGYLHIDSVMIRKQGSLFPIPYLHLEAQQGKTRRMVLFSSPFLEADMQGSMEYSAIPASILRMMRPYVPSLFRWDEVYPQQTNNNFNFFVHVRDTKLLTELLELPLEIYENSYLSGFVEDSTGTLQLKANFPSLRYGNSTFRNMALHCNGNPANFDCDFNSDMFMKNGTLINLNLAASAQDDQVSGRFTWENHDEVEYRGEIRLSTFLKKRQHSNRLYADVLLHPTEVVFRDSAWSINEASIRIDSLVHIDRFALQHGDQSVRASGILSASADDSLLVDLHNVQLGYVFDIVNFHSVDFDGRATGHARLSKIFAKPQVEADMEVKGFLFNDALMGDLKIKSGFDAANDAIPIDALIKGKDGKGTGIKGEVHPKHKNLDLHVAAQDCNLGFIQPYVEGIFSNFRGNATGNFRFFGGFKSLQLEGEGLADAAFRIDALGTEFRINDSVHVVPNRFSINRAFMADSEGHQGRVTARLNHTHFKHFDYNVQIDSEGMMLLNKPESFDLPFFGQVYGSGTVYLTGNAERLDVGGALSTTGDTEFCYKLTGNTVAEDNAFIQFTPIKFGNNPDPATVSTSATPLSPSNHQEERTESFSSHAEQYTMTTLPADAPIDIRLDLLLDINPTAHFKVVVDPKAGDYISCTGNGNIRIDFFNKGDFNMFGTYTIDRGVYKFSLQEVIRKDFSIRQGSSLTFGGNPYRALCNLQAIYTVNSVSLRDLGSDVVDVLQTSQTSVRVNCVMDVTGMISSPEIHLGIELPNENEEVQSVVRNFISTEDQMNMQILYLLGIGKFYTPDYANKTGTSSNAMSSVLSSTLSGQLNDMLSQVINSNNWNFGVNGSTGEEGWTDMEFQGMLSGQLLNNRLLINGNFGYRDNSMYTNQQSNFIGDFDIEYLLTKNGDIRLRAYNKSNDRYSTKTTLNTQGIGVVIRKDFDSWRQLIKWRTEKKQKKNED